MGGGLGPRPHSGWRGRALTASVLLLAASALVDCAQSPEEDAVEDEPPRAVGTAATTTQLASLRAAFPAIFSPAVFDAAPTGARSAADVMVPTHAAGVTRVTDRTSGMSLAFRLLGASRDSLGRRSEALVTFAAGGPEDADLVQRVSGAGVEPGLLGAAE